MFKKTTLAFCLSVALSFPALAENGYSRVIEDLPLIPGMVEMQDRAVIFDTAGGRILETAAQTADSADKVIAFYDKALPALGWAIAGHGHYTRAHEVLKITPSGASVSFKLSPQ